MQVDGHAESDHAARVPGGQTDPWKRIGEAIKRERGRRRQVDVAEKLKVRQATMSDWERSKTPPGVEQLAAIEDLFGLPKGHFLRAGGFVDDPCTRTTEEAIMGDLDLSELQKMALLGAYRSFRSSTEPSD